MFTCAHFDRTTRNCCIYETRPAMCRDYPYGKPCLHGERCEWDRGRGGLHPPPPVHYKLWVGRRVGQHAVPLRQRTHLVTFGADGKPRRPAQEHAEYLGTRIGT